MEEAPQTEVIKIAVALYRHKLGEPQAAGILHCALLAQREDRPFGDDVQLFQISNVRLDRETGEYVIVPWYKNHRSVSWLAETSTFIGCVVLGRGVECTMGEFWSLMDTSFPAAQNGYRLPEGESWDCAWWIFRCVEVLIIWQYLTVPLRNFTTLDAYRRFQALAALVDKHARANPGTVVSLDFETQEVEVEEDRRRLPQRSSGSRPRIEDPPIFHLRRPGT